MQKNILIVVGAAVLIGVAGFGVWKWQSLSSDTPASGATTTPESNFPVSASTSAPVTITPLPVPSESGSGLPPHPFINREISVPASFTVQEKAIVLADIEAVRVRLRNNPKDLNAWIDLGIRYKTINDYEAAREAWEYVSLMSPTNIVSYNNIGNLYHYELKDYVRAEMNLKQAVHNDPQYLLSYLNLHDLYRLSYQQNTTKAADILQQGIKQNPKAVDLMVALATYYRSKGNLADARTYYQQAIVVATELKNDALVITLKAELKAIE
ncbi:tetratricopeptide repeat protein [Candidatus Parcubacteria bacterium]|nr:tetratricopeptide repeat protein [Candidatus Parcubacteria bacterium]